MNKEKINSIKLRLAMHKKSLRDLADSIERIEKELEIIK